MLGGGNWAPWFVIWQSGASEDGIFYVGLLQNVRNENPNSSYNMKKKTPRKWCKIYWISQMQQHWVNGFYGTLDSNIEQGWLLKLKILENRHGVKEGETTIQHIRLSGVCFPFSS